MINTRQLSLTILEKTISDSSYANLLMRKELNAIPPVNRPFVSQMVYGVLRNYLLLEYQLKDEINEKTKLRLKLILMMALYERHFLSTREYALVNEYVELALNHYDKSFINAILRKNQPLNKAPGNTPEALSINHSLPLWIMKLLNKQYEEETLIKILEVYDSPARTYYRLNHKKCSFKDLEKYSIEIVDDDFFTCKKPLTVTEEFRKGYFYVQDVNSRYITDALNLNEDCTFLDMCSAPGSKLFNALEKIKEENAYANDLYPQRVELIKKKAGILGYSKVHYLNYDGTVLPLKTKKKFDRILLDAPCSGLGVISRRPDIKFHISPDSLDELEVLQSQLLDAAFELIENDGEMVYSTCTVNRKENSKQIEKFIQRHPEIQLLSEKTVLNIGGDLFYYAHLKKV